ncbi:hypothetical protein G6F65_012767 [Rhizopus arrhizus]|nr:hypothetical protein G6F65_012767 [Rhizopus arrhizus]
MTVTAGAASSSSAGGARSRTWDGSCGASLRCCGGGQWSPPVSPLQASTTVSRICTALLLGSAHAGVLATSIAPIRSARTTCHPVCRKTRCAVSAGSAGTVESSLLDCAICPVGADRWSARASIGDRHLHQIVVGAGRGLAGDRRHPAIDGQLLRAATSGAANGIDVEGVAPAQAARRIAVQLVGEVVGAGAKGGGHAPRAGGGGVVLAVVQADLVGGVLQAGQGQRGGLVDVGGNATGDVAEVHVGGDVAAALRQHVGGGGEAERGAGAVGAGGAAIAGGRHGGGAEQHFVPGPGQDHAGTAEGTAVRARGQDLIGRDLCEQLRGLRAVAAGQGHVVGQGQFLRGRRAARGQAGHLAEVGGVVELEIHAVTGAGLHRPPAGAAAATAAGTDAHAHPHPGGGQQAKRGGGAVHRDVERARGCARRIAVDVAERQCRVGDGRADRDGARRWRGQQPGHQQQAKQQHPHAAPSGMQCSGAGRGRAPDATPLGRSGTFSRHWPRLVQAVITNGRLAAIGQLHFAADLQWLAVHAQQGQAQRGPRSQLERDPGARALARRHPVLDAVGAHVLGQVEGVDRDPVALPRQQRADQQQAAIIGDADQAVLQSYRHAADAVGADHRERVGDLAGGEGVPAHPHQAAAGTGVGIVEAALARRTERVAADIVEDADLGQATIAVFAMTDLGAPADTAGTAIARHGLGDVGHPALAVAIALAGQAGLAVVAETGGDRQIDAAVVALVQVLVHRQVGRPALAPGARPEQAGVAVVLAIGIAQAQVAGAERAQPQQIHADRGLFADARRQVALQRAQVAVVAVAAHAAQSLCA